MKKVFLGSLFLVFLNGFSAQAGTLDPQKVIYCRANNESGNWMITIAPQPGGNYTVNNIAAGQNLAGSGSQLELETLGFFCHGANASVNLTTGEGTVDFKYNSGFLGGGCQRMRGTLSLCNNTAWPQ